MRKDFFILLAFIFYSSNFLRAIEIAPRISDREIIERLTRLEEGQKALREEMIARFEGIDKRFEGIDERFEAIDKRFEAIDKRFEAMEKIIEAHGKRIDDLAGLMWVILASIIGLIALIVWDRTTAIRPLRKEIFDLRKDYEKIKEFLKIYAKTDPKVEEAMKLADLL